MRVVIFLSKCQNEEGGFGGGPSQISHLAATYAATNALVICGTEFSYGIINRCSQLHKLVNSFRSKLYEFLMSLKRSDGSFTLHKEGESDIRYAKFFWFNNLRGTYCALSVASILNILTPELVEGTGEYIAKWVQFP